MRKLAPIVLFVYNRPVHTQRTVEALEGNIGADRSRLVIYSDAPRDGQDEANVKEVRSFLKSINGFERVDIVTRESNYGLSRSIVDGINESFDRDEKVIVLEDDLVTSKSYLMFMNDALELYQDEDRVASISGYTYPIETRLPATFLLRYADCWGWATWKDAWECYEDDGSRLLNKLKDGKLEREFDFDGAYPYARMLRSHAKGKLESWAVKWYASLFLRNKLSLFPGKSLVSNIGFDDSGTHCGSDCVFDTHAESKMPEMIRRRIEEDSDARREVANYLRSASGLRKRMGRLWKSVSNSSRL